MKPHLIDPIPIFAGDTRSMVEASADGILSGCGCRDMEVGVNVRTDLNPMAKATTKSSLTRCLSERSEMGAGKVMKLLSYLLPVSNIWTFFIHGRRCKFKINKTSMRTIRA